MDSVDWSASLTANEVAVRSVDGAVDLVDSTDVGATPGIGPVLPWGGLSNHACEIGVEVA